MPRALHHQFLRFAVVGTIGFVVNGAIVEALAPIVGPVYAQGMAFPLAVTVTWWLNRSYTFGASHHAMHYEWLRYVVGNMLGWTVNNGVYLLVVLRYAVAYRHPIIAVAAGSIAGMFFNFAVARWVIFRKRLPKSTKPVA